MKRLIFFIAALFIFQNASAQKETVSGLISGIQVGWLGGYYYYETRLAPQITIRVEPGLDFAFAYYNTFGSTQDIGLFLFPEIALEPRLYYNIAKRYREGKRTDANTANFISFKTRFHPGWVLSNVRDAYGIPDVAIMPTWGFRRTKFERFDYELGIGAGYRVFFDNVPESLIIGNGSNFVINIHFRIGIMMGKY